jgi:predicted histidine transporter YuiF (NhaC family)
MILEYGSSLMAGDYLQNVIDKLLNEASSKCPHSQTFQPNFSGIKYDDIDARATSESSYGFLWAILSVVLIMMLVCGLVTTAVKYIKQRIHANWMGQLSSSQIMQLAEEEKYEVRRQKDIDLRMKAMVFSDDCIPTVLRFGMPVIILGNIALFLSGHLSLGGTVNISGSFGE